MRYRYLDDFRRGISVFAIFSYGIAVLRTPQCPPLFRASLLKGIQSQVLEDIRRSCIIIVKCYNSPSPTLQSLESVTQAFSHTSPDFGAIIKIRND